jgi:hypothetical protein
VKSGIDLGPPQSRYVCFHFHIMIQFSDERSLLYGETRKENENERASDT